MSELMDVIQTYLHPVRSIFILLILMGATAAQAQRPALIGYYAGDGSDLPGRPLEQLTHVIWCFLHLQGDSIAPITEAQRSVIQDLVDRKKDAPDLKVLLSLGGWGGCATCSEVFGRQEGRKGFVRSMIKLLEETGADGIDLDWEYPAVQGPPGHAFGDQDKRNFTLLVKELRMSLGDEKEISFAAGGTDECLLQGFEWEHVMPLVDRVHIMSYDLVHGYSSATGHHTPLFSNSEQELSTDHAVGILLKEGVEPRKIVIGSAFYARVFSVSDTIGHGLYRPGKFDHAVSYHSLEKVVTTENGWKWYLDPQARAPYAFNATSMEFLTCDDATSVKAKVDYVREQGLGGIMFWQLRDDLPVGGLMDIMHQELRKP